MTKTEVLYANVANADEDTDEHYCYSLMGEMMQMLEICHRLIDEEDEGGLGDGEEAV